MSILETTRLNYSIRRIIKRNAMEYRFKAEFNSLIKQRSEIALQIYDRTFTEAQHAIMAALPEHYCEERNGISFNIEGCSHYEHLNGAMDSYTGGELNEFFRRDIPNVLRRFMQSAGYESLKLKRSDELAKEIERVAQRYSMLKEEFERASNQISTMLKSVTTIKGLKAAWPECEPFLPKTEEQVKPAAANLPAISIATLNAIFNLPVPKADLPEGNVIALGSK